MRVGILKAWTGIGQAKQGDVTASGARLPNGSLNGPPRSLRSLRPALRPASWVQSEPRQLNTNFQDRIGHRLKPSSPPLHTPTTDPNARTPAPPPSLTREKKGEKDSQNDNPLHNRRNNALQPLLDPRPVRAPLPLLPPARRPRLGNEHQRTAIATGIDRAELAAHQVQSVPHPIPSTLPSSFFG